MASPQWLAEALALDWPPGDPLVLAMAARNKCQTQQPARLLAEGPPVTAVAANYFLRMKTPEKASPVQEVCGVLGGERDASSGPPSLGKQPKLLGRQPVRGPEHLGRGLLGL